MTTHTRLTVADLEGMPEDDGNRYELIEGELSVTTQPHIKHQIIADTICRLLNVWDEQSQVGSLAVSAPGVIFDEEEAMAPDVVWIGPERFTTVIQEDGKLHGAPDLVVEVLSPGTKNEKRDRTIKPVRYAYWGVREYWLVDRFARTLSIYRLQADILQLIETLSGSNTVTSPLLPGFSCTVEDVFAKVPREQAS